MLGITVEEMQILNSRSDINEKNKKKKWVYSN